MLEFKLFSKKKQMSPPFRNEKITKLHLVMLTWGIIFKNEHARVMVLVHETPSECVLQMYEVLFAIPLRVNKL